MRPVGEPAGAARAAPGEPTEERATSSANASALSSRARSADASAALSSTTPVGVSVFPAEPPELAQQRHSRLLPAFRDAPLHSARAPRARLTAGSVAAHADGAPSATMVVFALRERCALTAPSVLGALFVPLAARCATASIHARRAAPAAQQLNFEQSAAVEQHVWCWSRGPAVPPAGHPRRLRLLRHHVRGAPDAG